MNHLLYACNLFLGMKISLTISSHMSVKELTESFDKYCIENQ